MGLLCAVAEYDEMPVRHNEDKLNATLSDAVRYKIDTRMSDNPHIKTNLLLQVSPCSYQLCLACTANSRSQQRPLGNFEASMLPCDQQKLTALSACHGRV